MIVPVLDKTPQHVATPFSPANIAGLTLWLKGDAGAYSDAGSTLCNDGDSVQQWNDQSGNGNHATQSNAGKRPTYKLAIKNGRPIVRFDGVDDFLQSSFSSVAQPLTILLVAVQRTGSANVVLYDGIASGHRNALTTFDDPTHDCVFAGTAEPSIGFTSDNSWHLWDIIFNGSSTVASRDNSADNAVAASPGTNDLTGMTIGSNTTNVAPANADIAELLVYSGSLSSGNRTLLRNYLNTRWAVY